ITDIFDHYSNNGSNRFCEVRVGDYVSDSPSDHGKCITNHIEIVRELSVPEILRLQFLQSDELVLVRNLLNQFTGAHIGGSMGLRLKGVNIKREKIGNIDLVLPYYQPVPEEFKENDNEIREEFHASSNDFDYCFI